MRLIDVYNFLKQYSDQVPGDTVDAIDLRLALLKEPVVEAIPIEWIKEFISKKGWTRHYLTEEIINAWEAENG